MSDTVSNQPGLGYCSKNFITLVFGPLRKKPDAIFREGRQSGEVHLEEA